MGTYKGPVAVGQHTADRSGEKLFFEAGGELGGVRVGKGKEDPGGFCDVAVWRKGGWVGGWVGG